MKIAFINPPDENTVVEFPDENGDSFLEADDYGYFPPLGLLYVASYLEANTKGHNIMFLDCVAEQISHIELRKRLEEFNPDVVGLTSFTISLYDCVKVAKTTKSINPNTHVCLGGHHPISYPNEAVQLPCIDSIIVGEGEKSFTDLVTSLEKSEDYTDILGVYTRESIKRAEKPKKDLRFLNTVIVKPAYMDEVDKIPFPNRKFIEHINYQSIIGVTNKLATILSSRGCPYACTFCNVPYKRYRERSMENLVDEIEQCLELGYKEFHFYDDLFNINEKKIMRFCDELEKRNLDIIWDFRGRVNGCTRESLARAKKMGLRMISFGVETGSDEGLKVLRKATTISKIQQTFSWCHELGIKTVADFMLGLPHERTRQDVLKNIDFVIRLNPTYAQFNIMTLYPHTEAYDQAVAKNLIVDGRWQEFAKNPTKDFYVDHWEEFMPTSELVKLHHLAYRKFYFRPSYILRSLLGIRSAYEIYAKVRGVLKLMRPLKALNRRIGLPLPS